MDKECMGMGKGSMVVLAAVILSLGMLGCSYLLAQGDYAPKVNVTGGPAYPNVYVSSTPPTHAISVSASASQRVDPDLLEMQFRVQTEDVNAKQSQSENAAVVAELKSNLKALGVDDKDIRTASYNVYPVYKSEYMCDKAGGGCHYESTLTGYRTIHYLGLRVTDLAKGGDMIDAASDAGENQTFVDYVQFTLKDESRRALEKSLLQNASAEAKSKAQSIAAGMGVSVGRPLSASESYSYYPYQPMYRSALMAEDMAGAPSTELSQGQVEVSVSVSSSYEIS